MNEDPVVAHMWDEYYFARGAKPTVATIRWTRAIARSPYWTEEARRLRERIYAEDYVRTFHSLWGERPFKSDSVAHGAERTRAEELLVQQVREHFDGFRPLVEAVTGNGLVPSMVPCLVVVWMVLCLMVVLVAWLVLVVVVIVVVGGTEELL